MFISVNGVRLFFDVDGEQLSPNGNTMREKPTVVMVHGGPGADHSIYKPFYSQLTDLAQVVYYDHRGNGRSDLDESHNWHLSQWAADLKGLCDELGIVRPIVLGTSFGGFVALSYALEYPQHAAGLILISTAAHVDFGEVYTAFERLGGVNIRVVAENYWEHPTDKSRAAYRSHCLPLYTRTADSSIEWAPRVLWRNETALWFNGPNNEHGRMDFRPRLADIRCPVHVMVGTDDPITPPAFSDDLVSRLDPALVTYSRFDDCGHGVVADKPDEALAAIRSFVSSLSD